MTHWILIADASGAKIFSIAGRNQPLQLVREIANADGRARSQKLVTDGPGRLSKSGAAGTRSAMQPKTSAHETNVQEFVRELAHALHHDLQQGQYLSLSLVAPPHLLGELREAMHKDVQQHIQSSLPRDLMKVRTQELLPHIQDLFTPGLFAS